MLVASFRNLNGNLIKRVNIDFGQSDVFILNTPEVDELEQGGSVELEALANQDICIHMLRLWLFMKLINRYQWFIVMRESFAWEIEEERTISGLGHEGCWTLRDTADVLLFAVLHNGAEIQPSQVVKP